jgi:recombination protein RecR
MQQYTEPISRLIKAFAGLPGIGEKTASRLALFVLNAKGGYAEELISSIGGVKEKVVLCKECMSFADDETCGICSDAARDPSQVCVVSDYKDLIAIEAAGAYHGRYHVLHGQLAPLKGIGPDEIKVTELVERVRGGGVKEIVIATAFDADGETTAIYLKKVFAGSNVRLTRIASGVPVGGHIEFMDGSTLGRALQGRQEA